MENAFNKEKLLSIKEIAAYLGRHPAYVYRLKTLGLKMIGGKASIKTVEKFLIKNPIPWKNFHKKEKN